MTDTTPMISVQHAQRRFGDFAALDDVSLDIPRGQLTSLLGPSGSGKSTLLRAVAGLDDLDGGTVTIAGRDVTGVAPQKRGIGFVFQHYAAFKHMTVRDNVAFGLSIRRRPKAEIARKVDDLLEIVGLAGFQHRYPAQLSGGQRQRMALARALAVDPEVLLLDEPFGALDAKVRAELRLWLRRLHQEVHVTTVLVTHDQEEALDISDRIAVLHQGRIQQVGTPEELYDHPASTFVMTFLGHVSTIAGRLVRPHDVVLERLPEGAPTPALPELAAVGTVRRVVRLGFEVRVELVDDATGGELVAQLTRGEVDDLHLLEGDRVVARATRVPDLPPVAEAGVEATATSSPTEPASAQGAAAEASAPVAVGA